jgi:DNA-binding CsgD family transcriptional regulator
MPRASSGLPTPREVDALRLLANGHTLTSAARVLGIGRAGVASLLVDAYRRLGVHDRAHAVAVAIRLELIPLEAIRLPDGVGAAQTPGHSDGRAQRPDRS